MQRLVMVCAAVAVWTTVSWASAADVRDVNYYRSIYNQIYDASRDQFDRAASSGEGRDYYNFQYVLEPTLSMFEATSETVYLERALNWAETMVSKAKVRDNNGDRNWKGVWKSPYSPIEIAFQLEDLQGSTGLARLCQIILTNEKLKAAYGQRVSTVCLFVKNDVVDKHLYHRQGERWFIADATNRKKGMDDKTGLLIQCVVPLYATGEVKYRELLLALARGFRNRFEPFRGGLIWDKGLGFEGFPVGDTSHANRYPSAALDLYRAGIVFSIEDVEGMAALLTKVIWDQSLEDPRFANFIDGSNYKYRQYEPWAAGIIYSGWVRLAEIDQTVYRVSAGALDAMLAGRRNPSLISMSNSYGKLAMAGHLAKATAVWMKAK